jgi:hypothetical protein
MVLEIIFGCLAVTFGYTSFNLLKKVERLETWVEEYTDRVIQTKTTLDQLDSEGKFEADDEIGVVFEGIKTTIEDLNKITEKDI